MNTDFRNYIISQFGFLIENNTTVSSNEFAELIKESYDITKERNLAVYEYLLSAEFHVSKTVNGYTHY